MLASVNKTFALRIASDNEESLAHIGVRRARRLSIESGGRIRPTSSRIGICKSRIGICKGLCHSLTSGAHDTSVRALCPCGCCAECSLHGYMPPQEVDTRVALGAALPCACVVGSCPEGIMWCVKDRRVQQVVGGELQRAMYRECFDSNAYSGGGSRNSPWFTDTSVRLVQFRPDCVRGIHPDNHGPEGLRGYRPLESLRRDLIIADEAAPVLMSAPLGPHG